MKLLSETWELRSALGIGDSSRCGRGGGCFMGVLVALLYGWSERVDGDVIVDVSTVEKDSVTEAFSCRGKS